ncbi:MAG: hypothetical protein IK059_01740, partial [Firmicutes bacterium]|nr:hypothetical protein [Bacillota bacterium]
KDVRTERKKMPVMCPSAEDVIDVNEKLREIISAEVYKRDYDIITAYFQKDKVDYESAIEVLDKIIETRAFGPCK